MNTIKESFPILSRQVYDKPLVYLDNAASSQKPEVVLKAIQHYYNFYNANVHRGIHLLSREATELMEESRRTVQHFINAAHEQEIIFTKGTTDAINLVAYGIEPLIKKDDEIMISVMEHHSNIVPWQMLAERTGAKIISLPLNENLDIDIPAYKNLLNKKTKIVAVTHISNALGVINPIKEIIDLAHSNNSYVLIDGAQSVPHFQMDVLSYGMDFFVFSGHKMYAPTGVGILYGKKELLEKMRPYQGGGEMIKEVTMETTTYASLPFKFEAGTPNISGNIVLKTAIDFIRKVGYKTIQENEAHIFQYLFSELKSLPEVIIYAENAREKSGAISFNLDIPGVHPSDAGFILDKQGIAVRTGHHCCQPLMNFIGVKGTIRASFGIYNTKEDIDKLIAALKLAIMMLK